MISLRCSGNGNNAGRRRAGTPGYGTKRPIRCGPCPKGQAVNTLVSVCGHDVFIFQAEGTFCWLPKLSASLTRAAKRTDSRDHFSAGRALASFSLALLNDLNLQMSSISFQQPKLFWKLINKTRYHSFFSQLVWGQLRHHNLHVTFTKNGSMSVLI